MITDPQTAFSLETLQQYLNGVKTVQELDPVKTYVTNYFVRTIFPSGVLMWCPDDCTLKYLSKGDTSDDFLAAESISIFNHETTKIEKFDVCKWFLSNKVPMHKVGCDFNKPRTYKIKGQTYINMSPGFL